MIDKRVNHNIQDVSSAVEAADGAGLSDWSGAGAGRLSDWSWDVSGAQGAGSTA